MNLNVLTSYLESLAPLALQEGYDNSGLIVGTPSRDIQSALISLDCTEEVLDEAIRLGCDLIISHHPIVFGGLKRFNESNYVERVVMKAIKNDIAIYAIHTNLDNVSQGVNGKIADKLGLENTRVLSPKSGLIKQLVVYVPESHADQLRKALFESGAGEIGNYKECSFNNSGIGTFTPTAGSDPFSGEIDKPHQGEEIRIEVIYPKHLEGRILKAMVENHPYEEVAHSIFQMDNKHQGVGAGIIGELKKPVSEMEFLAFVKERLQTRVIRHTSLLNKPIKHVAVCGGAGSFLLKNAIYSAADVFITGDFKYHEFFDAENKILINDIGHFESEQFTQELLLEIIQKKFPNFAVRLTEVNTNPINYYF
jgi:dinuclear metal center YbgI/SA1388 family protein